MLFFQLIIILFINVCLLKVQLYLILNKDASVCVLPQCLARGSIFSYYVKPYWDRMIDYKIETWWSTKQLRHNGRLWNRERMVDYNLIGRICELFLVQSPRNIDTDQTNHLPWMSLGYSKTRTTFVSLILLKLFGFDFW